MTDLGPLYIISGTHCNGGEHGHGHGHHHHHGHHAPEGVEDLESLIQNFGIAVLGKDQESADDVQPTADHSHVNIKVPFGKVSNKICYLYVLVSGTYQ